MEMIAFKEQLFIEGAKKGFTEMEIYYQNSRKLNTHIYKGDVDSYKIAIEGGVSFRGIYEGKMGYAIRKRSMSYDCPITG